MSSRIFGYICFTLCFFLFSSVSATEVSLDAIGEYQQLFEQMETQGMVRGYNDIEKRRCVAYDRGTYLAVSPACFLQGGMLPKLSFTEAIDALIPYVEDISAIYNTEDDAFWYESAELLFAPGLQTLADREIGKDVLALQLFAHHNMLIQVPKVVLALEQMHEYAFFAATRDTSTYGPCRLKNYLVAMGELDGYSLSPGEELNMNDLIAHHPEYCTGTAGRFMFYQGVCGGSTQLFWNSLVNPYLYVVERHPHGEFWANFYGSMGTDASIYENSKKLIIQNIGNELVYFKTFVGPDGNTVLLTAYPKKEGLRSYIQKQETGSLSAELINKVTDDAGALKYEQERSSRYWGVNETKDL